MPYLVKVGYHAQENRLTSQGYYISRSGKKVITRWGGIYIKSNPIVKFFWKSYSVPEKIHRFGSESQAKYFMQQKLRYFAKYQFDKLPPGFIIHSRKSYDE